MFVILGEALIDVVIDGNGDTLRAHIGGGPFNTGLALSRLEQETGFLFPLSSDFYGRKIASTMVDNNFSYICPYLSDYPTPLALSEVDTQGQARYQFYRYQTAERDLRTQELLRALPKKAKVVHTGTLAIADMPDADIVQNILSKARSQGATISIDPNIRANNFKDKARYRKIVLELLTMADIIKLSDDDLMFLYPKMQADQAFERFNQDFSAPLQILTRGARGCIAYYGNQTYSYDNHNLANIQGDSIGAGDCFVAGMLYALKKYDLLSVDALSKINRQEVTKVVKIAHQVAIKNCQHSGCHPPYLADLD